jgi:hypothetical protein
MLTNAMLVSANLINGSGRRFAAPQRQPVAIAVQHR